MMKNFEAQKRGYERQLTENAEELKKLQEKLNTIMSKHEGEVQEKKKEVNERNDMIEILDSNDIRNLEIIEKIGRGSGGEVVKIAKKAIYAMKIMDYSKITHESFQQFLKEYEIINMLNHPNIIKTYGIFLGDEKTPPSILLDFCPMNLENAIEKNSFTREQTVFVIYQIAEGMKYVHHQNIIHRDLKPSNILVSSDGTIKICDFGISKLMTAEEQSMTKGIGTQKFMAPEIINEEDYDEKVDIYSFGVVVYFILSGGQIPKIKIRDICNGLKAEIPSSFTSFTNKLINKCWNFDPKDRPSFKNICEEIEMNKFKLLDLNKLETKEVKIMVKKHKEIIPQYST